MNRLLIIICIAVPTFFASESFAYEADHLQKNVGTLSCKMLPHSGINLLIHSTSEIRCEFEPSEGGPKEYYKGETGIKFGLDLSINRKTNMVYLVRTEHFRPGTHQLAGKYSGVGGGITLGISAGDTTPIQNNDKSISLQPMSAKKSGVGAGAGFTYICLEEDNLKKD